VKIAVADFVVLKTVELGTYGTEFVELDVVDAAVEGATVALVMRREVQ